MQVVRSRRDGQTVANRYYITMCMDYAHAPFNGFYELWGEFPEAEMGNSRLPPLEKLAAVRYDADSLAAATQREVSSRHPGGNVKRGTRHTVY